MKYYGNLAYDDYSPEPKTEPKIKKPKKKTAYMGKGKNSAMANRRIGIRRIIAIIVLALSAGFMISEFVAVHETRSEIERQEKSLSNAEAITSQKTFELEQSVDLAKIEEEPTTRLGMQRPEKYQTIYINVPMDDVTDTTADSVEGVNNSVKGFFERLKSNIVEFFSIK